MLEYELLHGIDMEASYIGAAVYSFCYPVIVAISLEKEYISPILNFLFLSFDNFLFSHVQFLHYIVALASAIITADFKTIRWYTTTCIDGYRYYYYYTVRTRKRFSLLLLFASYCFCWVKVWSGWWQPTTIVSRSTINSEGGRWTVYINTILQKHQERERENILVAVGCGLVNMKAYGRASS